MPKKMVPTGPVPQNKIPHLFSSPAGKERAGRALKLGHKTTFLGGVTKLWRLNASRSPPNIARATRWGDTYIRVAQGPEQKDGKLKISKNINYITIKYTYTHI